MPYEQILYDVTDGIATITLNRPDKLNAWTMRMGVEVRHAFHAADRDPEARVIVITGAGKGYCSGADMDMLQGLQKGGVAGGPDSSRSRRIPACRRRCAASTATRWV